VQENSASGIGVYFFPFAIAGKFQPPIQAAGAPN
jgi:hypothetical protein